MISIKSEKEIEIMREGGKIAARVIKEVERAIKPGLTTLELNQLAEELIEEAGAKPSFKNFKRYPMATCISVNDEVVHGLPSKRIIKEGDIVGFDVGVYFGGYHTDTAATFGIGKITPKAQRLIDVTRQALEVGIQQTKAGVKLGDIQSVIQVIIEKAGFSVVRDLAGHGIGKNLQEEPSITNFGQKGTGPTLSERMTLAIEPMTTSGDWHIKIMGDGWTIKTLDGSLSAHFEHTIAVNKNKAEILTEE